MRRSRGRRSTGQLLPHPVRITLMGAPVAEGMSPENCIAWPRGGGCNMNVTTAVALVGVALLGGAPAVPLVAQQPDLSGRWTFDAAQSDNPRVMLQSQDSAGGESRGSRPGSGYRRGGGRGGFGRGRDGGGRGGMSAAQRQGVRQTMQLVFPAPPAFTVMQTHTHAAFCPHHR